MGITAAESQFVRDLVPQCRNATLLHHLFYNSSVESRNHQGLCSSYHLGTEKKYQRKVWTRPHANSKVIKRKASRAPRALSVKTQFITDVDRLLRKESSLFNMFLLNLHTHQNGGKVDIHFSPFCPTQDHRETSALWKQPETSIDMF